MALLDELIAVLRDKDVLSNKPEEKISGPELCKKIKDKGFLRDYRDNYIINSFPSLVRDPSSPIAKVDSGYGYYRRPNFNNQGDNEIADIPLVDNVILNGIGLVGKPEEKFRAFYMRWAEIDNNSFPRYIDHLRATRQPQGINKWKFPDVVLLDWEVGRISETGYELDPALLAIKQSLGDQPFRLTSVELKIEVSLSNVREYFFQCVSNSKWAHSADLVVAKPISDTLLAKEIRRLGSSFGVSVYSFDLDDEFISQLPNADVIDRLTEPEFQRLLEKVKINKISSAAMRDSLDWDHIEDLRKYSQDFADVFNWISRCLADKTPHTFSKYGSIMSEELQQRIREMESIKREIGRMNNGG